MGIIESLALALGASFMSGFNLYGVAFVLGALQFFGLTELPASLELLSSPYVLTAAGPCSPRACAAAGPPRSGPFAAARPRSRIRSAHPRLPPRALKKWTKDAARKHVVSSARRTFRTFEESTH